MDSDQGKLFIGGISWDTSEDTLKEYFGNYGEVLQTVIMRDKITGRPRGFGFVVFADPSILDTVLQDKHTIDGRTVEAKRALSREEQHTSSRSGNLNAGRSFSGGGNFKTKKIFVGGLPPTLTEEGFRQHFETYGHVNDVVVMYDQSTQRPRGFGFISFDTEDAVDRVLHKTFHELNGKLVEVKRALPKDANPGSGGGRSMGGGGYQAYGASGANAGSYDSRMESSRYIQPQSTGGGFPQMHGLWSKGYTGDGVWGRGASLATGEWEKNMVLADEVLPEHLCGGTYRSRRRKRKVKPTLSYQEKKERRILKKFGKNGMALGADEETKVKLEGGKKVLGKPRVAGSARGRELRAAAALARFKKQKEEPAITKLEKIETDSESESEYEDDEPDSKDAVDVDGSRMVDGQGRGLVKICEDGDSNNSSARGELEELYGMFRRVKRESPEATATRSLRGIQDKGKVKLEPDDAPGPEVGRRIKAEPDDGRFGIDVSVQPPGTDVTRMKDAHAKAATPKTRLKNDNPAMDGQGSQSTSCSMCLFSNPTPAMTCGMCANVLDISATLNSWHCQSDTCRNTLYRNMEDCGVCGLCGRRRNSPV